jgi:GNAT superfamily N-acetyltransferase
MDLAHGHSGGGAGPMIFFAKFAGMHTADDHTLYSLVFESHLGLGSELGVSGNDFVTEYEFAIRRVPAEAGEKQEIVGKGRLSLIQFSLAMDVGFPLHIVMDTTSSILEMSEQLFSWEKDGQPFDKLDELFDDEPIFNRDVCFIERLELLPAYRGRGIGKEVLTSIARRFYTSCGLIVVKAYPLQHEARLPNVRDEWTKEMRLDELEQDLEQAQYQLYNWYQKLGLSDPFDREYFIARPGELAQVARTGVDTV